MDLNSEEIKQYSRHLLVHEIGELGQKKLKLAKVLIIGAGGLGSPILQYLTAAGIGNLGIIDHDNVDISNLQRQVLFNHDDIGKNKAEVAGRKLGLLNPHIKFHIFNFALSPENALDIFNEFDIIVDGSDNFPTRYLVNDASMIAGKPLVFGSIFKFEGQVSLFNYEKGPSYRCLFPNPPSPGEVPNCSEIGVLGVLPGIIGSFQANEVLKLVLGIGENLSGKLLTFNALNYSQQIFKYSKNEDLKITEVQKEYESFCGLNLEIDQISWTDLKNFQRKYSLLDVRTLEERELSSIEGVHIPLDEIEENWATLDLEKTAIVYCQSGKRSEAAIQILEKKFPETKFLNLEGGLNKINS